MPIFITVIRVLLQNNFGCGFMDHSVLSFWLRSFLHTAVYRYENFKLQKLLEVPYRNFGTSLKLRKYPHQHYRYLLGISDTCFSVNKAGMLLVILLVPTYHPPVLSKQTSLDFVTALVNHMHFMYQQLVFVGYCLLAIVIVAIVVVCICISGVV